MSPALISAEAAMTARTIMARNASSLPGFGARRETPHPDVAFGAVATSPGRNSGVPDLRIMVPNPGTPGSRNSGVPDLRIMMPNPGTPGSRNSGVPDLRIMMPNPGTP